MGRAEPDFFFPLQGEVFGVCSGHLYQLCRVLTWEATLLVLKSFASHVTSERLEKSSLGTVEARAYLGSKVTDPILISHSFAS